MQNKLALITVVYNNYSVLEDFFKSLEKQTDQDFHLFIADQSNADMKIKIKSNSYTTVIDSENLGYSHGINICIKQAMREGYEVFCILNNDIYFEKDFISKVQKSLEENPESIIAGKIYYAPGYEYHNKRYQKKDLGKVLWYAGGHIDWKNVFAIHRGVDEVDKGQYDKFEQTDFVNGCLTAFDKTVLDKVGLWNEKYFLFYEDADFSERAKRKGLKLYYDPSIVLWHKNSQSTGGSGSVLHQKYQARNRLHFGMKYASLRVKFHLLKNYLFP